MITSLIFAGGCVLALGFLSLLSRAALLACVTAAWLIIGGHFVVALVLADWLSAIVLALHALALAVIIAIASKARRARAIMHEFDRAFAAVHFPSREAPGAPHGAGDAGKRDGERDAPNLLGMGSTAGSAGLPRSFSAGDQP